MKPLLNIQSSPRSDGSLSHTLSQEFVAEWQRNRESSTIVTRDLAKSSLPFVSAPWIGGIFVRAEQRSGEQQQALETSDELIAELFAAITS